FLKYFISSCFYSFKLNKNLSKWIYRIKIFDFTQKYFHDNDFSIDKQEHKSKIIIIIYRNRVFALVKT
ncbi:MAG: hypothetical protein E7K74_00510, partial [Finegoldia magna]|nr:hypothetical protein [Finegoldia magna]